MSDRNDVLRDAALRYHELPRPGKLEVRATKPLANGRDLALRLLAGRGGGLPGDQGRAPANAARYTARGNLVAVVTNGTAVLGLGNIGALASKPVMEGKAVLFKKFANIDCFDIELAETDPEKLADIVCALEPTFGAINLEDIKAPDCFTVERHLPRADGDPGVPRRPARHRHRRRRGGDERAPSRGQGVGGRSRSSRPAAARRGSPASTCC